MKSNELSERNNHWIS